MMTPVYLNPQSSPFSHVEQANDQDQRLKLFISSSYNNQATASSCSSLISSFHTFFDSFDDQRAGSSTTTLGHDHSLQYHHNTDKHMWDCGTSTYDQASSPSSLVQPHLVDVISTKDHRLMSAYADHEREINGGGGEVGKSNNNIRPRAVKWMSSKMRLMQKMTNPDLVPASTTENHILAAAEIAEHKFQVVRYQENSDETSFSRNSNNNTTPDVRVCSDCNTNTTPLWRSGPRGPKSLCNACGIRQRKVRRAMAEAAAAAAAANGFVVGATDTSSAKGKVANKEKKLRGSHSTNVTRCKNKSKLIVTDTASVSPNNKINSNNNKIYFKGLGFQRVFSQDVAEAAILLMELSCGLINHS